MIFLSYKLLRLLKFCINSAYFFRVVPFKWDSEAELIYYVQTSRWNLYKWDIIKYFIPPYQLLISFLYWQSLYKFNECRHPYCSIIYTSEGLYLLCSLIFAIFQITLIHQWSQIMNSMNAFINYVKNLQGKSQRKK